MLITGMLVNYEWILSISNVIIHTVLLGSTGLTRTSVLAIAKIRGHFDSWAVNA